MHRRANEKTVRASVVVLDVSAGGLRIRTTDTVPESGEVRIKFAGMVRDGEAHILPMGEATVAGIEFAQSRNPKSYTLPPNPIGGPMPADRRHFLPQSAGLAALTGVAGCSTAESKSGRPRRPIHLRPPGRHARHQRGRHRHHPGSLIMPPEVIRAMEEASRQFVPMRELHDKSGKHLANIIGVPAVTSRAALASAITVATAACLVATTPSCAPCLM
ncbi:MAG: hypothetical protein R2748_33290 [Bryobacterales bacterium]